MSESSSDDQHPTAQEEDHSNGLELITEVRTPRPEAHDNSQTDQALQNISRASRKCESVNAYLALSVRPFLRTVCLVVRIASVYFRRGLLLNPIEIPQ